MKTRNPVKSKEIDLGLAISGALLEPGKRRTLKELAAFANCDTSAIRLIEKVALKKLRHPSRISRFLD